MNLPKSCSFGLLDLWALPPTQDVTSSPSSPAGVCAVTVGRKQLVVSNDSNNRFHIPKVRIRTFGVRICSFSNLYGHRTTFSTSVKHNSSAKAVMGSGLTSCFGFFYRQPGGGERQIQWLVNEGANFCHKWCLVASELRPLRRSINLDLTLRYIQNS